MAGSITAPASAKPRPIYPPTALLGFAIAAAAVCIASSLRILFHSLWGEEHALLIFLPSILITGWYAGFRPAVAATVAETILAVYYLPPAGFLAITDPSDGAAIPLFALFSLALGRMASDQRRSKEKADQNLRVADERQRQLQCEVQERRRIEDLLRRQTHALQAHIELMELAHDTIIVRTVEGYITFWNAAAQRMYGWSDDDVQGKNIHQLLRSEYGTTLHEINITLFREGRWAGEVTHTRRDGKRVTVVTRWAVQRDEDGKPIAVIEINRDVTERRQAEEEIHRLNADLQRRIAELQTLFETIPIGIAVAEGPDCSLIKRNRALAEMLEAPIETDIGQSAMPFRVFQHGRELKPRELPMHLAANRRQELKDWEGDVLRPDGELVHLLAYASPLYDEAGAVRGCIGTYVNITERKQTEAELLQKQDEIEALNHRLRRAMAETHHRVKNNLQVISALVDLQAMEHGDMVPVSEITRMGHHIRSLAAIHDLLTQEAKTDLDANYLSAREALDKLMPMVREMAHGRPITYSADDARLPVRHGTALTILVNELVSNALKHGLGEIIIRFTVTPDEPSERRKIGSRGATGVARLEVCDSGPGFPPDFDPTTAAHTGLELVENLSRWDLGGSAAYLTRGDSGACVQITFPVGNTPEEVG